MNNILVFNDIFLFLCLSLTFEVTEISQSLTLRKDFCRKLYLVITQGINQD